MNKDTKAVLTVIAAWLVIQTDPGLAVASETTFATKELTEAKFFNPTERTKYAGRLFSSRESYPLMEMRRLCEPHTGLDTAQVKCRKIKGAAGYICDYKCSKHWLVGGRNK
mgnify:CR=1 FL=1